MAEATDKQEGAAAEAEEPVLRGVEERLHRRAKTLEVLADPAWPGDGALGAPAARSAMWWFTGVAILLAFPRQYVAAASAAVLAVVFWWLQRKNQPEEETAQEDAGTSTAEVDLDAEPTAPPAVVEAQVVSDEPADPDEIEGP